MKSVRKNIECIDLSSDSDAESNKCEDNPARVMKVNVVTLSYQEIPS